MNRRFGLVPLIGLLVALALLFTGCAGRPGEDSNEASISKAAATPSATSSPTAAASPTATASATQTPASTTTAASNGTATVQDNGGKKETVPLVTQASKTASADTTKDPMTPASVSADICKTLVDWKTLYDCIETNHAQWYIDGVNQREKFTGFDWADVTRWAKAKNAATAEVRAIEVYGEGISNAEARKRAAELVGDMKVAKQLAIVRQPACFDNTRGLEDEVMQDFVYCPPDSRKVRVSLLPAVMEKGKIAGIRDTDSGVFVDCINVWWIPELIKVPGLPPQENKPPKKTPPPPGGGSCVKNCGETPPCKHNCLEAKDYRQGTQHQGNNKPGGGGKAPTQTDSVGPPKGGNPPVTYTPPPKPTPKPDPTQPPRPTPTQPAEGGDGGGNNDNPGGSDPGKP